MKRFFALILLAAALLTACESSQENSAEPANEGQGASQGTAEVAQKPENPSKNEAFYEYTSQHWVDDDTLMIINQNNIKLIGLDNNIKSEYSVQLKEDAEIASSVVLGENLLVLEEGAMAAEIDGKWQLYCGGLYDSSGAAIQRLPDFQYDYDNSNYIVDGKEYPFDSIKLCPVYEAKAIDENTAAIYSNMGLFFLNIKTGALTLIDDYTHFHEKYGRFDVYYGISDLYADWGKGVYYLAYDDDDLSNTAGHLYYADLKTGEKKKLSEELYTSFCAQTHLPVLTRTQDNETGDTISTQFFYLYEGTVRELAQQSGMAWCYNTLRIENGVRFLMEAYDEEEFIASVYDVVDGTIANKSSSVLFTDKQRVFSGLVTVQGEIGSLDYIYSLADKTYVYHEKSKETEELPYYIKRWNDWGFFRSSSYFPEIKDASGQPSSIRIAPLVLKQ